MQTKTLVIGLIASLSVGCIHRAKDVSKVRHDVDRFANSDARYQWFELSDSQYEASSQSQGQRLLPRDHPMTRHLQSWVDRVWGEMVLSDPRLKEAPLPKVRIRHSPTVDAYVAPQTVCLTTQVVIPDRSPPGESFGSWLVYDRQNSTTLGAITTALPCLEATRWEAENADFLSWLLGSDCRPELQGKKVVFAPTCKATADVRPGPYAGLITKITHNIITVDVGLLQGMTEPQVIAVLAHELGHYSMSHRTTRPEDYGYFYLIPSHTTGTKPPPLSATHPLHPEIRAIIQTVREEPLRPFPVYPQQNLHGSAVVVLASFSNRLADDSIRNLCAGEASGCVAACQNLGKRLSEIKPLLSSRDSSSSSSASSDTRWQNLEADIERCTQHLKAQSFGSELSRGFMTAFAYRQDVTRDLTKEGTLWQLLQQASDKAKTLALSLAKRHADAIRTAQEQGIGWYTAEQEADDIATDLTARLGLASDTVMEMTIRLGELTGQPGAEICKDRAKKAFPDFVSPGRFVDDHHDFCFRAYNSYLEQKRHEKDRQALRSPTVGKALLSPSEWDRLVKSLSTHPS